MIKYFKISDNIVRLKRYFQCSDSTKNVREIVELNFLDNNCSHCEAMETETMFPAGPPKAESNIHKPQQNSPDFNQNSSSQSKLSRQNILIYNR